MTICPICGAAVGPRGANKSFPFCSPRCKSIDLGKWLTGEYAIPGAPLEDELELEEAASAPEPDPDDSPEARCGARADRPPKPDMRH